MDAKEVGELIKASGGFEVPKETKSAIDILERLGNFMEIEKAGDSKEREILSLRESGIISESEAKKFLATVKEQKESVGGIKYDVEFVEQVMGPIEKENKDRFVRLSLNVYRTAIRNAAEILRTLVEG